jgi:hypothetical protein
VVKEDIFCESLFIFLEFAKMTKVVWNSKVNIKDANNMTLEFLQKRRQVIEPKE